MKTRFNFQRPPERAWYRVSLVRGYGEDEQLTAVILQWEPDNAKWYKPEFIEGRAEVGYLDRVGLDDHGEWTVYDVRPL